MLSLFAEAATVTLPSLDASHLILSLIAAGLAWFTHGKINPTVQANPELAAALQVLLDQGVQALVKLAAEKTGQPPVKP